jgi:hypothetical protein
MDLGIAKFFFAQKKPLENGLTEMLSSLVANSQIYIIIIITIQMNGRKTPVKDTLSRMMKKDETAPQSSS